MSYAEAEAMAQRTIWTSGGLSQALHAAHGALLVHRTLGVDPSAEHALQDFVDRHEGRMPLMDGPQRLRTTNAGGRQAS